MLLITNATTTTVILTLTERQTLPQPDYKFLFVNRETNVPLEFVLPFAADVSQYKERYNEFVLLYNVLPALNQIPQDNGFYTYTVTQNQDGHLLETGLLEVTLPTPPIFKENERTNEYIANQ